MDDLFKRIDGGKIDDEQITSYIFRSGSGTNVARVNRVKRYLGEDSSQWERIRTRAMQDLLGKMIDTSSDPIRDVISGAALRRAMASYGEDNMQAMFGKQLFDSLETYSRTVLLATQKTESGAIVAAGIALHPLANLPRLAWMSVMGKWMRGNGLRYYTDGLQAENTRVAGALLSRSMIEFQMLAEEHTSEPIPLDLGLLLN